MRFTCIDRSSRTDGSMALSRVMQQDTSTFQHRRKYSHLPLANSGKFNDLKKRTSVKKCLIERERKPHLRIESTHCVAVSSLSSLTPKETLAEYTGEPGAIFLGFVCSPLKGNPNVSKKLSSQAARRISCSSSRVGDLDMLLGYANYGQIHFLIECV